MEFTTQLTGNDVTVLNYLPDAHRGDDYEIEDADFVVKWWVEIETREWGVKGISWFVRYMIGTFTLVRLDDNGDEESSDRVSFNQDDFDIEMDIQIDGDTLSIEALEIDYKDKTAVLM